MPEQGQLNYMAVRSAGKVPVFYWAFPHSWSTRAYKCMLNLFYSARAHTLKVVVLMEVTGYYGHSGSSDSSA